jgi:hypothetical protein
MNPVHMATMAKAGISRTTARKKRVAMAMRTVVAPR